MNINNISSIKKYFGMFLVFFLILIIATKGLLQGGYFQQDEWAGFSLVIRYATLPWWHVFIPFEMHFSPIPALFWSVMYQMFRLNAVPYYLVEFAIHSATAALLVVLARRLTNNTVASILTGLLFLLNARAHQAFTHLAIFNSTDTCMFFIALFFVVLSGIKGNRYSLKDALKLVGIFLLAVLTREEGFIIVPLALTYVLCFDRKKLSRRNITPILLIGLSLLLIVVGRFFVQKLNTNPVPVKYQINGSRAKYNLLTIPVKLVVQNVVSYPPVAEFLLQKHEKIYPGMIKNFYTDNAPLMDVAFFYIAMMASVFFGAAIWVFKPVRVGSLFVFSIVWIFSHTIMLSFVAYPIFILEPRYLYFSAFPVFLFISVVLHAAYSFPVKNAVFKHAKHVLIFVIVVGYIRYSVADIRSVVAREILQGTAKKSVLSNIKKTLPAISDNTVLFIKCKRACSRNGELGIPNENVLPFSSGPGMILLISYITGQENEWSRIFDDSFLFDIYAEDYKKIGNKSFGYFVTKSKLEAAMKANKVSKESVVALEYNESDYTFSDISKRFREEIVL